MSHILTVQDALEESLTEGSPNSLWVVNNGVEWQLKRSSASTQGVRPSTVVLVIEDQVRKTFEMILREAEQLFQRQMEEYSQNEASREKARKAKKKMPAPISKPTVMTVDEARTEFDGYVTTHIGCVRIPHRYPFVPVNLVDYIPKNKLLNPDGELIRCVNEGLLLIVTEEFALNHLRLRKKAEEEAAISLEDEPGSEANSIYQDEVNAPDELVSGPLNRPKPKPGSIVEQENRDDRLKQFASWVNGDQTIPLHMGRKSLADEMQETLDILAQEESDREVERALERKHEAHYELLQTLRATEDLRKYNLWYNRVGRVLRRFLFWI